MILSGGPASVTDAGSPRAAPEIFTLGVPVLGICYGQQTMMAQLGGTVEAGHHREFGRAWVSPTDTHDPLFTGLFQTGREEVWMSHGDRVTALAPGFAVIGASPERPVRDHHRPRPPLLRRPVPPRGAPHRRTAAGILRNFTDLAGFTGDWTMAAYKDQAIAAIRAQVGDDRVICGLSGGVDSSVAAVLIHEAVGDQLTCVFVDTGLMRQGEAEEVVTLFRDHYNIPLIHADESDRFLDAARRRHRPGDQAQDHRPAVHRGLRGPRRRGRRRDASSPRARSTPTSSRASASPAAPRSPSRATTTSAACPSACT